jgi:ubiquinone/menaquinone biosynthesis C-methylase UbiE
MEFWSNWSEDYHKRFYRNVKEYPWLITRHNYILDLFDQEGKSILDIGCGPGEMIRDLRRRNCRVWGIDIAEGMLRLAQKNLGGNADSGRTFLSCGNIETLAFKERTFDGAICAGVIEYLDEDQKALRELNRVLRKNGTLIITVRNKACPAKILDSLLDAVKQSPTGRKAVRATKKALNMDQGQVRPYISYRKHYPWKLDKNLAQFGFIKEDFRYFHFYPFFAPLDKLFTKIFVSMGLRMERLTNTSLGFLGSGYIVKARKIKDL